MLTTSNKLITPLLVICASLALGGCSKKKDALAEANRIEEACNAGKKDEAQDIALKARDANELFKKAFDGTTETISDKKKVNVCSPVVQVELSARIENGPII